MSRLLVAVDLSERAAEVVSRVNELCVGVGHTVDLMYVSPRVAAPTMGHPAAAELLGQLVHPQAADLNQLEALMKVAVDEPRRGECLVREGDAAQAIITECKRGYDMVAVGTHGRTGLAAVLIGSVAERVVRLAPLPVLVVR